jgi:hypothetical protein
VRRANLIILLVEILVLGALFSASDVLPGYGYATWITADVLAYDDNANNESRRFIQAISNEEVIYVKNSDDYDDIGIIPNFTLMRHNLLTGERESREFEHQAVSGITYIEDTETIFIWGNNYDNDYKNSTSMLYAFDKNLNLQWENSTDIDIGGVCFIKGRYYPNNGRMFIETAQDGTPVKTHTLEGDGLISNLSSPQVQGNGTLILGRADEFEKGGVVMVCEKLGNSFSVTDIILEEDRFPAEAHIRENILLIESVNLRIFYESAEKKRDIRIDITDIDQSKTIRIMDLSELCKKYALNYIAIDEFELVNDSGYIHMRGLMNADSKYRKEGAAFLLFNFDLRSKDITAYAVRPGFDSQTQFETDLFHNGQNELSYTVTAFDPEDNVKGTAILKIDKSDLLRAQ